MSNANPSPNTRFKLGQSGNPSGRPKGTLKDYDRKKFMAMNDEEKEAFLSKVSAEMRYRMAEGNPRQEIEGEVNVKITKLEEIQKATRNILNARSD